MSEHNPRDIIAEVIVDRFLRKGGNPKEADAWWADPLAEQILAALERAGFKVAP